MEFISILRNNELKIFSTLDKYRGYKHSYRDIEVVKITQLEMKANIEIKAGLFLAIKSKTKRLIWELL